LRCLDAGKLDHLFANTETKARMRADIEQEQLRLVEIQWRRVQIRGRGGPGAATADARRLWYGTRGPTGFPVDGCYRAAAGVGSERFALPACAEVIGGLV
jgi:hypothetical protein